MLSSYTYLFVKILNFKTLNFEVPNLKIIFSIITLYFVMLCIKLVKCASKME